MKKVILSTIFAVLAMAATAQVRFGLKAGLNISDINGKSAGQSYSKDTKSLVGFHIGGVADIAFGGKFFFQPGLLFSTKGTKQESGGFKTTLAPSYLEIPLNVGYRAELGAAKLNLFVGPYFAFGIGGKSKAESGSFSVTNNIKYGTSDDSDLKGTDVGLNLGASVDISKINIGLQYGFGLTNLVPKGGDKDNTIKNSVISLSVGYFFGE